MSFNIISVDAKEIDCWLTGKELRSLYRKHEGDLPEINLFEDLDLLGPADDEKVVIPNLSWCGTWSGNSYPVFQEILLSLHGAAKFSVTWEDGSTEYFRLADGALEDVEVEW
jgi:hypothetical protein